jgi:hypothetical protein
MRNFFRPQDGGYPDGPFMEPLHPTGPDIIGPGTVCQPTPLTTSGPGATIQDVI